MTELLIKDAFDTARLVACYRAIENERPGSLIRDPYARRLAGKRGEELVCAYPHSKNEVWGTVLRTLIYDEILLRSIEQEQIDTVINLAAGLDTRPYRLPLPASLHWIEVDLPPVLQYKEEQLANEEPVCKLERIPLDITDYAARKRFLASVSERSKQIFILTEGLLIYLTAEQVVAIARDLYEQEAMHWWLTEFVSRLAPMRSGQSWNNIAAESAQERFAPADGAAFFEQYGWQVAEFHSAIEAVLRFHIPIRFRWLLRLLRRVAPQKPEAGTAQAGFVLLRRAFSPSTEILQPRCEKSPEEEELPGTGQ